MLTFWVGLSHPESGPCQVLGTMSLVNVETQRFSLSRDHIHNMSRDFADGVP